MLGFIIEAYREKRLLPQLAKPKGSQGLRADGGLSTGDGSDAGSGEKGSGQAQPGPLTVYKSDTCYGIGKQVLKLFSAQAAPEAITNEVRGWKIVHRCKVAADPAQGQQEDGLRILRLPRLESSPTKGWQDQLHTAMKGLWKLTRKGLVHLDVRSANIVSGQVMNVTAQLCVAAFSFLFYYYHCLFPFFLFLVLFLYCVDRTDEPPQIVGLLCWLRMVSGQLLARAV